MQMYVNYYDREMKLEEEHNTIGIILCRNKSDAVVKYTLPENNEQIFASKYRVCTVNGGINNANFDRRTLSNI